MTRRPLASPAVAPAGEWRQRLIVEFEYPVLFTRTMFDPGNLTLRAALRPGGGRRARVLVVVDSGVSAAWPGLIAKLTAYFTAHADALELARRPYELVGGERAKSNPALIHALQAAFFEASLDRHSEVLIIGGGAVLDATGYAAGLSHRGVRIVRAPTTVLAQSEAGIGVRNAVNAFGTKDALGIFAPPFAVINDFDFIATLPARDRRAGVAEAVKIALVCDAEFFSWIEAHAKALYAGEPEATASMIGRCAELHLAQLRDSGDPYKSGALDLGHWAAHELETQTGHALRHGEAVAIGVALDSRYAQLIGRLDESVAARIEALLRALGLPRWHEGLDLRDDAGRLAVLAGLERSTVTLLDDIGRASAAPSIDARSMVAAVAVLRERAR